jgi:hypothetical protein
MHKGARGNTDPDPELEAAWAAASGAADDTSEPVVRRRDRRPPGLQAPPSPARGGGGGGGGVDPALEAAWGASVSAADPRDLADHPPSPSRFKHPPRRQQQPKPAQSRLSQPKQRVPSRDGREMADTDPCVISRFVQVSFCVDSC